MASSDQDTLKKMEEIMTRMTATIIGRFHYLKALPHSPPHRRSSSSPSAGWLAPRSLPLRTRGQWRTPSSSMIKINFDGAIFTKECKSGIGVVLCDAHVLNLLPTLSRLRLRNMCT
nr:hypothetical protein CFP56_31892 [Quercus suber]